MCWEVCGLFHKNFTVWGPMCGADSICFPGCKVACKFWQAVSPAARTESADKSLFPEVPRLEDQGEYVRVSWSRPLGPADSERRPHEALVYAVLLRGLVHREHWEGAGQTPHRNTSLSRSQVKQSSELVIVAVGQHGQCASTRLPLGPELDLSEPADEGFNSDLVSMLADEATALTSCAPPRLHAMRLSSGGAKVEADISWNCAVSPRVKYEVTWRMQDTGVDVTGRLYTSRQSATLPLWPESSYTVYVRELSSSGDTHAETQPLFVNTAGLVPPAAPPTFRESNTPPNCVRLDIVTGCAAAVSALMLAFGILLVVTVLGRRRRSAQRHKSYTSGLPVASKNSSYERRSRRGSQHCGGPRALFSGVAQTGGPASPVGESREDLLSAHEKDAGAKHFVFEPRLE
ncbi:uncharacterized protein LOC144167097 [Haemaphysalis longicornis]